MREDFLCLYIELVKMRLTTRFDSFAWKAKENTVFPQTGCH